MPVVRVAVAGDEDEARVLYYSCHTQYKLDLVIEGMGENERKRLILVVFCFAYLSVSLQSCSVIGVETKDTWPGTVTKLRMVWIPIVFLQFYLVPIFPRNVFFFFFLIVFFPPDQRATTATGVVTFPGTARSPKRRESSSATLAGKLVTWPVTVITPMSRSATPAVGLATSRSCAIRWNVTGKYGSVWRSKPGATVWPNFYYFEALQF